MAAPIGNQNAKKAKIWHGAITRALARISKGKGFDAGLDTLADKLVSQAVAGEQWAMIEIGNRLDGKPAQIVIGDEDDPIRAIIRIERTIVDPKS